MDFRLALELNDYDTVVKYKTDQTSAPIDDAKDVKYHKGTSSNGQCWPIRRTVLPIR